MFLLIAENAEGEIWTWTIVHTTKKMKKNQIRTAVPMLTATDRVQVFRVPSKLGKESVESLCELLSLVQGEGKIGKELNRGIIALIGSMLDQTCTIYTDLLKEK